MGRLVVIEGLDGAGKRTLADKLVGALGGELTKLSKDQAEYIGVDVEGPFKPEHYRY